MTKYLYPIILSFVFCPYFVRASRDSTKVTFTLDHNRMILPVTAYSKEGRLQKFKAWFDNGNPVMSITEQLVQELGLTIVADSMGGHVVKSPYASIGIGGMLLPITGLSIEVEKASGVGSGLDAAITLPSTLLRHYEVIVDYPAEELTIGMPGALRFEGIAVKSYVNPKNALIQIPAALDDDSFHIALDLGTPVSFISRDLVSKWGKTHPSWPSVCGAIGVANLWGMDSEVNWRLLRVHHLLFGGVDLPSLAAVTCPPDWLDYFIKRVGINTAGLIGAEALDHFRIGFDYAHETVFFQKSNQSPRTNFDLVGLTLRPEADGRYSVLGVAEYNGKASVDGIMKGDILLKVNNHKVTGLTMGKVWSLLGGPPGTVHSLMIRRGSKAIVTKAIVYPFLDQ
jgi:hypothetical protein